MAGEDRYRLAALREVRALGERTRKGELATAVGDARQAQAKLDGARARTNVARAALVTALRGRDELLAAGATSLELSRAELFIARRRRDLEQATAEEDRCEAAHSARQGTVEAARLHLARSRAEREVIERHFERWRAERRKVVDRRED